MISLAAHETLHLALDDGVRSVHNRVAYINVDNDDLVVIYRAGVVVFADVYRKNPDYPSVYCSGSYNNIDSYIKKNKPSAMLEVWNDD